MNYGDDYIIGVGSNPGVVRGWKGRLCRYVALEILDCKHIQKEKKRKEKKRDGGDYGKREVQIHL